MLGIYCRISKEKEQGKGQSLADQERLGIELAKQLGLDHKIYVDDGLSGAGDNIEDRPQFERFLADVSNRVLTHVFAYDQSRFERNPQVRFVINKLFKDNNIKYYTHLDGGEVDLHDPQAEFFGDLLSVINKYHVTTTKIKVKSALKNRAMLGKGQAVMPYGYDKDSEGYIIINEEEAEVVKRIFEMSLSGIGTKTIAETLQNEGIPTRYNKLGKGSLTVVNKYTGQKTTTNKADVKWSGNSIRGIIVNTIHKGEKRFKDMVIEVPAIFEKDYWDKVNENLPKNRNTRTVSNAKYDYLLKGLIRCGVCGRNMYGRKRADKHDNHYSCSSKRIKSENCGNRSINIDKLDDFVWRKLFLKHGFMQSLRSHFNKNKKGSDSLDVNEQVVVLKKKIESLKNQNEKAIQYVLEDIWKMEDVSVILEKNKKTIADTEKEIELLQSEIKIINNTDRILKKYQDSIPIHEGDFEFKRKVISDFIKNIIVSFDPVTKEYILQLEYLVNIQDEEYKGDVMPRPVKSWSEFTDANKKKDVSKPRPDIAQRM
ncbi:MAG: hypothetical protein DI539_09520 [Flavobacterium psychrophilum]|nr:MAG: hypothetical protein DI539_09520 [Flavobacterium psychrophilum]